MPYVMRLSDELDKVKLVALAMSSGEPAWRYLRDFYPDARQGRGFIRLTNDLAKAKRFDTFAAVMEEWKRQSTVVPYRDDGQPNRPLTGYTMEPVRLPD